MSRVNESPNDRVKLSEIVDLCGKDPHEEYCWPLDDVKNLGATLCYHAKQHVEAIDRTIIPTTDELEQALINLELDYSPAKVFVNEDYSYERFTKILTTEIDFTSSPGLPYCIEHYTNRDLFQWNGMTFSEVRAREVHQEVLSRIQSLLKAPSADPVYVFIKPEPHKLSKADKKSWRIISGVSIVDQFVDRFLFGDLLNNMISKYKEIPAKVGFHPSGGGLRWLNKRVTHPLTADKSAFDWTVTGWMIGALEIFLNNMIFDASSEWKVLLHNRLQSLYREARFSTNRGEFVDQQVPGIQKSGSLGTIAFNSIFQNLIHEIAVQRSGVACATPFAVGDDTLQNFKGSADELQRYLKAMETTGVKVKEYSTQAEYEFIGCKFNKVENSLEPMYVSKHMFKMLYLPQDPLLAAASLSSLQYNYAYLPAYLRFIHRKLAEIDCSQLRSERFLKAWYEWDSNPYSITRLMMQ